VARWGPRFVVENPSGGDRSLRSRIQCLLDDHTLFSKYASTPRSPRNPYQASTRCRTIPELSPVVAHSTPPGLIIVPDTLKVGSVPKLVAMSKAQPGKLNSATGPATTEPIFAG